MEPWGTPRKCLTNRHKVVPIIQNRFKPMCQENFLCSLRSVKTSLLLVYLDVFNVHSLNTVSARNIP